MQSPKTVTSSDLDRGGSAESSDCRRFANPDAILIAAAGTPGATPQKELVARGYKGKIFQTHGVGNPDFLRVVGKDGNGTILPVGPMLVYEQLPDSNPAKKSAGEYVRQYEAKFGTRATFGG